MTSYVTQSYYSSTLDHHQMANQQQAQTFN